VGVEPGATGGNVPLPCAGAGGTIVGARRGAFGEEAALAAPPAEAGVGDEPATPAPPSNGGNSRGANACGVDAAGGA
jgi:hypothetical protein